MHLLQVRLKAQEKKVDHLERAKRLEEIPLLKLQFEEFKEESKVLWDEQEKERIQKEKEQREVDIVNRDRLARMTADKDSYLESLLKDRKNLFDKKQSEFEAQVAEERSMRLQRRKEERMEDRRREWQGCLQYLSQIIFGFYFISVTSHTERGLTCEFAARAGGGVAAEAGRGGATGARRARGEGSCGEGARNGGVRAQTGGT